MASRAPLLILIGGPNGAGKTTFAREFLPSVGINEFLNPDLIAAGLSPLDPPVAAIRAARLLLTRWRELVDDGRDFAFESTLSGLTYATMIRSAKLRGYRLELCYLHLATLQHSIRRVRERVKKGGHHVPLPDLRRRFLPSLRNFFRIYLPLAERAALYDATFQPPSLVTQWEGSRIHRSSSKHHEVILSRLG